jgi:hypothetical protein
LNTIRAAAGPRRAGEGGQSIRCLFGLILALAVVLPGCSTNAERTRQQGPPVMSADASNITVYRENASRDGLFDMPVFVNSVPVASLAGGGQYGFSLEPGTYVLSYILGLSECDETIQIEPRRSYAFTLGPSCAFGKEGR